MIRGKSVAIVGSAPSCTANMPGFVESFECVIRVNNYVTGIAQGCRTDIHYSFFGGSIRKRAEDLLNDGVRLLWNKCPNEKAIDSAWHERNGKRNGVDFRYIYLARAGWWPCDVYAPTVENFLEKVELLGGHIPSTGFAAILDVLACEPKSCYLTGFDFFTSGKHNVNEQWHPGPADDPIKHMPELERAWLANNLTKHPITVDRKLRQVLSGVANGTETNI